MTTTNSIAASVQPASAGAQNFAEISAKANFATSEVKDSQESGRSQNDQQNDHISALRFITCGSVDDGKSTLIGRLLVDSRAVLQDHLAGVQRGGETDLALLTDGLSAEREQGITIDVAYRYFATEAR